MRFSPTKSIFSSLAVLPVKVAFAAALVVSFGVTVTSYSASAIFAPVVIVIVVPSASTVKEQSTVEVPRFTATLSSVVTVLFALTVILLAPVCSAVIANSASSFATTFAVVAAV